MSMREEPEPLIKSLQALHAALFGGGEDAMRASAERRAAAARAVDRITNRVSIDVEDDWRVVKAELRAAYREIQRVVESRDGAPVA
jgi:RNA-splicing ligase RtcB